MKSLHALRSWLAVGMMLSAVPAFGQTDNRFAIGGEFTVKTSDHASAEDGARGKFGPGLLWRFGQGKEGWGFHWGLPWYSVEIDRPIGGLSTELGELKVRPFMAGYGYTYSLARRLNYSVAQRLNVSAKVLGGYAIGSMELASTAIDAYQTRLGAQAVSAEATNTFVLRPQIGVWYDLTSRIGINLNAGYMIARPDVIVTSTFGTDRRTARADQFSIRIGLVYSIFKSSPRQSALYKDVRPSTP